MDLQVEVNKKNAKVLPFLQDASYYLKKADYYFQKNKWQKALRYSRKAIEVEPENSLSHYNLACLLSSVGCLEEANENFEHIVEKLEPSLTECYFLMAVNYGLLDDLTRARKYLCRYIDAEPEGDMTDEARELLLTISEEVGADLGPAFSIQEREELVIKILELNRGELTKRFQSDPFFRRTMRSGLYQVGDDLKEDIIRFYGVMGDKEAISALYEFVRNPWVKERLRQVAILELKNMGVRGNCPVFFEGRFTDLNLDEYFLSAPVWQKEWQDVLEYTLRNMRHRSGYNEDFYKDTRAIWLDFINTVYPDVPRIHKLDTWAAGLEYSLVRFHFLNITQKELAETYGVSSASVSAKFKKINKALNIEQKAYQNVLSYFKERALSAD